MKVIYGYGCGCKRTITSEELYIALPWCGTHGGFSRDLAVMSVTLTRRRRASYITLSHVGLLLRSRHHRDSWHGSTKHQSAIPATRMYISRGFSVNTTASKLCLLTACVLTLPYYPVYGLASTISARVYRVR